MLFNSLEFALFLPTVFLLYWLILQRSWRLQNVLLLGASYLFYGWWDWRFLLLIIFSTVVDYTIGLRLAATPNPTTRKGLLTLSLVTNLGLLGLFKYFNFFIESFVDLFAQAGIGLNITTLQIILPVGISFYTFQTLSYTLDIYRGKLKPTSDAVAFFAFVSFFPQLVAGPIERAADLLKKIKKERRFSYAMAKDGLRQILWGIFKKVAIADLLAIPVNLIFADSSQMSGSVLVLGAIFFAFQIYCDFSGYSDVAIGVAKLFDFQLSTNFVSPYFAKNIAEFWQRWHITLSTWFRDYVYIPLGGSRCSKATHMRNILITFTVSGLWHGANWTFVIWGFLHGLSYLPLILWNPERFDRYLAHQSPFGRMTGRGLQMGGTFAVVTLGWIFFRAEDLTHALSYLHHLFSRSLFSLPAADWSIYLVPILFLVTVEWLQRDKRHPLQIDRIPLPVRWLIYLTLAFWAIASFRQETPFIYFQF